MKILEQILTDPTWGVMALAIMSILVIVFIFMYWASQQENKTLESINDFNDVSYEAMRKAAKLLMDEHEKTISKLRQDKETAEVLARDCAKTVSNLEKSEKALKSTLTRRTKELIGCLNLAGTDECNKRADRLKKELETSKKKAA